MKSLVRSTALALVVGFLAVPVSAFAAAPQQGTMSDMAPAPAKKPMLSPPATATVELDGKTLTVHYNSPAMRGRKIMGGLVPYGEVWRTGANPATTLVTPVDLMIGTLKVPAGTYTLFTLPSAGTWQLIVSKKTGEWGIPYPGAQFDLGRTAMDHAKLPAPQESMSIAFEKTHGHTTQLHVRWETTDEWVTVTAK